MFGRFDGSWEGLTLGILLGEDVAPVDGWEMGDNDGVLEGDMLGFWEDVSSGEEVGPNEGMGLGFFGGAWNGLTLGLLLGNTVGLAEGWEVGAICLYHCWFSCPTEPLVNKISGLPSTPF